jgi:UDP-N-acetylmuramoylalanine--D-glutamate ligase
VYASDASAASAAREAAAALAGRGIAAEAGGHDLDRIARAALVVVSPGVPPTAPPVRVAHEAGVPVVSEIDLALRALPALRYVAVTGTNGKTTTTAIAGHLLEALGLDSVTAGNIGTPLAQFALRPRAPAWAALEVSSFQLHDTPGIAPTVGVLTNLSPDHLDRYPSVAAYYADKRLLYRNAVATSAWVDNADDPTARGLKGEAPGVAYGFSLARDDVAAWYDQAGDRLVVLGEPLVDRGEVALMGDHNVANALAAALAVMVADPAHRTAAARARIAQGLRTFRALAHRLEVVGEVDGVQWINDSKATNVGSTLVAVQGMTRPTVLLLGGRHKGEPYTGLADAIRRSCRAVLAYGEAAPLIERDLGGVVPLERLGSSFGEVIRRARALAEPGDAVLLSPACSSYDMFRDYEERGAEFRRLARA